MLGVSTSDMRLQVLSQLIGEVIILIDYLTSAIFVITVETTSPTELSNLKMWDVS